MDQLKRKKLLLQIFVKLIEVFMLVPIIVSFIFTQTFFCGDLEGFWFKVRLLMALTFDGTKTTIILASFYLKKYFTLEVKIFLGVLVVISIGFTMNSILNDMSSDREKAKTETQEYKDYKKDIQKKEEEIEKAEKKVNNEIKARDNSINGLGEYVVKGRGTTFNNYKKNITKYENEVEKLKAEKEDIVKPEQFEYREINNSINTKLLDPVIDDYKTKMLIISLFFGVFLEVCTLFLGRVRNLLQKVIEDIKTDINEKEKVEEATKILNSSTMNKNKTELKTNGKSYKNNNNKNVINLQKKEKPINEIFVFILRKAMENNKKVPPISKMVECSNYSQKQIVATLKELTDSNKIKKEGRFYYLNEERCVMNG